MCSTRIDERREQVPVAAEEVVVEVVNRELSKPLMPCFEKLVPPPPP